MLLSFWCGMVVGSSECCINERLSKRVYKPHWFTGGIVVATNTARVPLYFT